MGVVNIPHGYVVVVLVALLAAQVTFAFAVGDFSVSASPSSVSVAEGGSSSSTIMVTSHNGFSDPVALSYSWFGDAPSDITVNLPASVTPAPNGSARAEIQLLASTSATVGVFTLRVTGTSANATHQTDIIVTLVKAETETTTSTSTQTLTQVNVSLALRLFGENLGIIIIIALVILVFSIVAHVLLHLPARPPRYY